MRRIVRFAVLVVVSMAAGCGTGWIGSDMSASPSDASSGRTPAQTAPTAQQSAGSPAAKADAPAAGAVAGLPAGWEVAPRGDYTARQAGGRVTITATGESPTAGYQVKLFESPLKIWPPQFILAHKKPDGIVAQVITPYEATASFKADRKVATVVVNDASGRRIVNVAQAEK